MAMTKQTEALEMAIEYIDKLKSTGQTNWLEINVIQNACKEALAEQPTNMVTVPLDVLEDMQRRLKATQEPVYTNGDRTMTMKDRNFTSEGNGYIQDNNFDFDAGLRIDGDFVDAERDQYAQMICSALNTQQPTQEPVLYIDQNGLDGHATWAQATRCQDSDIALYTHPKQWQGLSDEEIESMGEEYSVYISKHLVHAIEAKLREKNDD
jgi:hypothetical protein